MYGRYLRETILEDHDIDGAGADGLHGKMEPTEGGPNQMSKWLLWIPPDL